MTDNSFATPAIILLVDNDEWRARSLESIFAPGSVVVVRAHTGRQAVDLVQRISPDAVITILDLPDMTGGDLIREVRASASVRRNTPVLALAPSDPGRRERLEILRAGAWDILLPPLDAEEILLRVGTYVTAKQESDAAREGSLVDPALGCYNLAGLVKRIDELAADASRYRRDLACIAVGLLDRDESGRAASFHREALQPIANALSTTIRLSDAFACLTRGEFVIVAPSTDSSGAARLAERLLAALDQVMAPGHPASGARAGIAALETTQEIVPGDLLSRARAALRRAEESRGDRISGLGGAPN
jgi:PleD family two-component response regulator